MNELSCFPLTKLSASSNFRIVLLRIYYFVILKFRYDINIEFELVVQLYLFFANFNISYYITLNNIEIFIRKKIDHRK